MPDITAHPEEIADCASRVRGLSGRASGLNAAATAAAVPELSWGVLGHLTTLHSNYDELLRELQSHFDKMSEGFDKIGTNLRDSAQAYRDADDMSAQHLASFLNEPHSGASGAAAAASHGRAPTNLGALGTSYSNQWSTSGMSGNLLTQSAKSVPMVNGSYLLIKDSMQLSRDVHSGDAASIGKDVTSVLSDMNTYVQDGITLAGAIADPLNFVISKGLGWLLNVVAPLKQAVDLVSGDPNATSKAATQFGDIARQVEQLAKTYDDHLRTGLRSWSGEAGEAAAKKLSKFHEGLEGTASLAGHAAAILQGSSVLMKVAEDVMKGILSDFVEWLVVTWVAAQLAAPETGGASEAGAAGATVAEEAVAMSRATAEISKVRQLLNKIMEIVQRLRAALRNSAVGEKFVGNVVEAQTGGRLATSASGSLSGSVKKRGLEAVGITKRARYDPETADTPHKNQSVDAVGSVGAIGGRLADLEKARQYRNEGNQQDDASTECDLDV